MGWIPEILPGPITSICCSGTCCLSQPLIFLLICIQCLGVFGCPLQGHGANGQMFVIPLFLVLLLASWQ